MAERRNINTGTRWEDIVGYSRAVRMGNFVEVAGTTAVDDAGNLVGAGDPAAQTRFIIKKIERSLVACGATLADVVRTRIYVTDISMWEAVGRMHGEYFKDIRPVSTMVEVSRLINPDMLVEIEVTAIVSD
jgi:enamine deaminase RidA (YjgF/YER057c/UK114 family)